MPDADLGKTVEGIMGGAYGSAGERCMAVSVVVAVGEAGDALVAKLKETASALKVGPGLEPGSEMGPLISTEHKARVTGYIEKGQAQKARLILDGRQHPKNTGPGNFLGPTLFDHVTADMAIYREEIFGPVLSVVRAKTLDEAIGLVNRNPFGNGAAIFTSSGGTARKFQEEVSAGMVGVNVSVPVPLSFFPFAGWKNSFFGDLHAHGKDGVAFYTETKVVTSRWFSGDGPGGKNMTIALR
jgi:malonate-semialdehyde dehydrogenase (acetylating)/methylmalonate-semialdehyde dehydrogenase